jgi:hypothetical protein
MTSDERDTIAESAFVALRRLVSPSRRAELERHAALDEQNQQNFQQQMAQKDALFRLRPAARGSRPHAH